MSASLLRCSSEVAYTVKKTLELTSEYAKMTCYNCTKTISRKILSALFLSDPGSEKAHQITCCVDIEY